MNAACPEGRAVFFEQTTPEVVCFFEQTTPEVACFRYDSYVAGMKIFRRGDYDE